MDLKVGEINRTPCECCIIITCVFSYRLGNLFKIIKSSLYHLGLLAINVLASSRYQGQRSNIHRMNREMCDLMTFNTVCCRATALMKKNAIFEHSVFVLPRNTSRIFKDIFKFKYLKMFKTHLT